MPLERTRSIRITKYNHMNTSTEKCGLNPLGSRTAYVSPKIEVMDMQSETAILTGSVPDNDGIPVIGDDYDY